MFGRQCRRTTVLSLLCLGILGGIGFAHGSHRFPAPLAGLLHITALVEILYCRFIYLLVAVPAAFIIGWTHGSLTAQAYARWQQHENYKTSIYLTAADDAVYGYHSQLSFTGGRTIVGGLKLPGQVQVSGFGENAVYQGDILQVTGKLRAGRGQYAARISYAQLHIIKHQPSTIANLRRKFTAGMESALPEPMASFAMGLLVGQRSNLPDSVKQALLMVGLTHIIAVSGYNMTIMLEASKRLLGGHSKRLTTLIAFVLMGVFLLFTGASASIVRATIVSTLSIWAHYYGRRFHPILLILLAASATAWLNPHYVWADLSWYLSFLAFFGVLVLAPLIARQSRRGWQKSLLVMVALESLCAEVMTLPIVLFSFGQVSLIGLLANVLLVTLVPLAMLLSLIAGLAGMVTVSIAGWLSWPARLLLTAMLDIAHALSSIPHIFLQNLALSLGGMLSLYAGIALLIAILWFKKVPKSAIITDKNSV